MKCPVDGTTLALAERAGIEIDYCPQCRGVWLDRGELDRIIERAGTGYGPQPRHDEHQHHRDDEYGDRRYGDHDGHDGHDEHDEHHGRRRGRRGGAFSGLAGLLGGDED